MNNDHINMSDLVAAIGLNADLALKFYFDDAVINPGYHVTEVRHAAINSIDCGKNSSTEQWNEFTIQLLDGSEKSNQGHMQGSKFLNIVGAAMKSLPSDNEPFLFFEFAPDNGPIRKLSVESIEQKESELAVQLGSERAVCKPFQRSKAALLSGVALQTSGEGCCADGAPLKSGGCCG